MPPVACTVFVLGVTGVYLARRVVPAGETRTATAVAAATLALAVAVAATRLLLALGCFWLPLFWVFSATPAFVARFWPGTVATPAPGSWHGVLTGADRTALLPVIVGVVALGLAFAAAGYLPIWAWDATGYHLPFVNYVVQARSSAGVPPDMPYLSTYPHNVEYLFAILRLTLSDDTWVDAGQIPVAVVGAGAIAALSMRWGARAAPALAAGALWLAVPGVFLQLPSGYVDVCVAAFMLLTTYWIVSPVSPASVVLSGVALGLFLGSKPSAPLATVLLFALLAVRAWRAGRTRWLLAAAAASLALGAPDYLASLTRFGNPVWPVTVEVGPIRLPGQKTISDLLTAGAAAPRVEGPLWSRIWRSWTSFRAPPAFDMRVGGLGTVAVLLAIPGALFGMRRRPAGAPIALAAALLGPDPAAARFILAFPALCLALAASAASCLRGRSFVAATTAAALLAALDLGHAAPGLTGEGPPLERYRAMSDEERLRAVGPAGRPDAWIDLRRSLGAGEAFAFDASFDNSYLLWRRQLQNEVVFVSASLSAAEVEALLVHKRVRFLIAGPGSPAGSLLAARADCFRRMFACPAQSCAVYEVRGPSCLQGST
jgi:hypothetical protein